MSNNAVAGDEYVYIYRDSEPTPVEFARHRRITHGLSTPAGNGGGSTFGTQTPQIAEQTLEQNLAGARSEPEKVHALRLPSDPEHPILDQIALATQLSLADIQAEQRIRGSAAAR